MDDRPPLIGARHQGQTGSCLHSGNDLSAYLHRSDSKSRLNFLEVLRQPHTGQVSNEVTLAYWERQQLAAALVAVLSAGGQHFADTAAWPARLAAAQAPRGSVLPGSLPRGPSWAA